MNGAALGSPFFLWLGLSNPPLNELHVPAFRESHSANHRQLPALLEALTTGT
jgi:hypothetical protein